MKYSWFLVLATVVTNMVAASNDSKITLYLAMPVEPELYQNLRNIIEDISNPESPNYGSWLEKHEVDNLIYSPEWTFRQVEEWLSDLPDTEVVWYPDGALIRMLVPTAEKEFSVNLVPGKNNEQFYTNSTYRIPVALQGAVMAVEGFLPMNTNWNQTRMISRAKNVNKLVVDEGMATREVFERVYSIPNNWLDQRVSLSAMEFAGAMGFSNFDLTYNEVSNGLPCNDIASDHIIGGNNSPGLESQLDVQMLGTLAANGDLWYWHCPGWMLGCAATLNNKVELPDIMSVSWGWAAEKQCQICNCGNLTSEQYVQRSNYEFMKLVARGITLVVASGDAGSPGRTNEGCLASYSHINPVFPGGSEWVTSVSATFLVKGSGNNYSWTTPVCQHEVHCATGLEQWGVSHPYVGWTTGGGFDIWTSTPYWQMDAVLGYLESGIELPSKKWWNPSGRGYADVAAIGHNCLVYGLGWYGQGWGGVDGTSCSCPVFAAILGILNHHQISRGRPKLGYANPLLYWMQQKDPSTFTDIVVGNTTCTEYSCCGDEFGFLATKGWDPVTGLGTPVVSNMLAFLDKHF